MRIEIYGPDGRTVIVDSEGADLDTAIAAAVDAYRASEAPAKAMRQFGFAPAAEVRVDLPTYEQRFADVRLATGAPA